MSSFWCLCSFSVGSGVVLRVFVLGLPFGRKVSHSRGGWMTLKRQYC